MSAARSRLTNAEVARTLREMALFLEMKGVSFKPRAYEKAAYAVEALERPLASVYEEEGLDGILELPSVGKGIGEKLEELLRKGRMGELEELRRETPVDVLELTGLEGLGAKGVKALYDELGVRNVAELDEACREHRVQGVSRFGKKSEEKLQRAIETWKQSSGRHPIGEVLPLAREIEARLARLRGVERAAVAGSIRRCRETIGDLDFLVVSGKPEPVMDAFASMPEVSEVYARGETKTLVRLASGIDADLRVVPRESFGAALAYFTGSKDHNVALRRIAQKRRLKLNEYGLFKGRKSVAGETEEEVYEALGLPWIPPELREDTGEIGAAQAGELPELIEAADLRGDLQIQTDWTDGTASIEEMVEAAWKMGLEYIAITDHTRDLPMTGGSDEAQLRKQAAAVRKIDGRLQKFRVLTGAEVNIRKDGSLDVDDAALAELDVVGAAIHSAFDQSRAEATRRVIRAMENPHVDILFHPTARVLGRRAPVDLDMDAVIEAAKRTGTVLEIDALPERLDLRDEHVRKAVEAGVALVIDSDAHNPAHLRCPAEFGVAVARRGWATRSDVINTLPVNEFLGRLKGGRTRGGGRRRKGGRRGGKR